MAEPFLLVALIAAVRRILVITAELGAQARPSEVQFQQCGSWGSSPRSSSPWWPRW